MKTINTILSEIKERKDYLINLITVFIYIYFTAFYIMSHAEIGLEKYANFIALILMGLLAVYVIYDGKNLFSLYSLLALVFCGYCFITLIWSPAKDEAFSRSFTVFKLLVLTVLLYNFTVKEDKVETLVKALYVAGLFYTAFFFLYFGTDAILESIFSGSRIGGEIANQNTLSFRISISAVIGMYYVLFRKHYWNIVPVAFCFIGILAPGSRQGFLSFFIGVFLLIFFMGKGYKKLISVGIVVVLIISMFLLMKLPFFSPIMSRITGAIGDIKSSAGGEASSTRIEMIFTGINIFKAHPILGAGVGVSSSVTMEMYGWSSYFHNNYVELLACTGLVGFFIYYFWTCFPVFKGIKDRKWTELFYLAVTLTITNLAGQMASVTYYDKLSAVLILITWCVVYSAGKHAEQ